MPTLEERVAYLEGRLGFRFGEDLRTSYREFRGDSSLGDHFAAVDDLRSTYREFRADSNRQFGELRAEVEHSRTDMARQFVEVRSQFDEVRGRIDDLRGELGQEVRRLDVKMDTQFRWLAGMQVTTILAIGSAVVGLYFK